LVIVEGCYSTEGDIPDLHRPIELKERYGAWLMVDDAHALGVLGASGRGLAERFGADPAKIDILMGTLSKTLASCGGFIAGPKASSRC
jgi:8-amino-7-oxononanoate synthase